MVFKLSLSICSLFKSEHILAYFRTNIGVESTARAAYEHGYALILAEDAMSSANAEQHRFAVHTIFPRLGRVRSTAQVLDLLS